MEQPQVIRIWRAPPGAPAKYVTVDDRGQLVRAFESLAAIKSYHGHAIRAGAAVLKRELNHTYRPQKGPFAADKEKI